MAYHRGEPARGASAILGTNQMRKLLFSLACAACALSAPAQASYIFGFSPTGSQTLTLNGTTVIQAYQTGWFDQNGSHSAGNTNYYTGDDPGFTLRSFFGFNLANVNFPVTSAVLNIGNGNDSGLPGTFGVWDFDGTLDTNQSYSSLAIFNDLGSGTFYGSTGVTSGIPIVSVAFNSAALGKLNASAGSTFFVGGVLNGTGGAVPEPATWALLILGFGAIGGAMRRSKQAVRVSFA